MTISERVDCGEIVGNVPFFMKTAHHPVAHDPAAVHQKGGSFREPVFSQDAVQAACLFFEVAEQWKGSDAEAFGKSPGRVDGIYTDGQNAGFQTLEDQGIALQTGELGRSDGCECQRVENQQDIPVISEGAQGDIVSVGAGKCKVRCLFACSDHRYLPVF